MALALVVGAMPAAATQPAVSSASVGGEEAAPPPPTSQGAPTNAPPEDLGRLAQDVIASNPTIENQRAAVEVLRARMAGARAGYLPEATANAGLQRRKTEILSGDGRDSAFTAKDADLSIRLPLFDGFRTRSSVRVSKFELESGLAALEGVTSDVLLELGTAYADVRRDRQIQDYAQGQYDAVARQLVGTSKRLDVGEATLTDARQATARLATATSGLYAAVEGVIASESVFAAIVGRLPGALPDPPPVRGVPATLQEARAIALESNPFLRAAHLNERAADQAINLAKAALYPTVDAVTGAEYLSGGVANLFTGRLPGERAGFFGGLRARVPIYLPRESAEVQRAREVHKQRLAQIAAVERQITRDIDIAWARWKTASATVGSAREAVAANEAAAEGVEKEAQGGARTLLDVLDAQNELLASRILLERALRDEFVANVSILAAMGRLNALAGGALPDRP